MTVPFPDLPDATTQAELLAQNKDRLLSLDETNFKMPLVLRDRALEQSRSLRDEFTPLLGRMTAFYSTQKISEITAAYENLVIHSFLFYAASMVAEQPWSLQQKQDFKDLAEKMRDYDIRYMKWARAIFHGDVAQNSFLDQIHAGRGYVDDAEDTIALTNLLLGNSSFFPNPFFTEEQLRQAESDARLFLWWLQGRDENKPPKGSPPDLRIRAYNLWLDTYNTVARAGRAMIEDEVEATQRFPRISSVKSQSSSKPSNANENTTSPPNRVENFGTN